MSSTNKPPASTTTGPRKTFMDVLSSSPDKASPQNGSDFTFGGASKTTGPIRPQTAAHSSQSTPSFFATKSNTSFGSQLQPATNLNNSLNNSFNSGQAQNASTQSSAAVAKDTPTSGRSSSQVTHNTDQNGDAKISVPPNPQTAAPATQPAKRPSAAKPDAIFGSQSQPAAFSNKSFEKFQNLNAAMQSTANANGVPSFGHSFQQMAQAANQSFHDAFSKPTARSTSKPILGTTTSTTPPGSPSQAALAASAFLFGTATFPTAKPSGSLTFGSLGGVPQTSAKTHTDALQEARQKTSISLRSLLNSGNFSDLVLRCGDKEWKLHKSIVCCQSMFFANACTGDFQEASSGVVTLPANERPQVEKMVDFLYSSSYDGMSLPDHVHAYIAGVRYQITALEEYASDRFQIGTKQTFGTGWSLPSPSAIATSIELISDALLPAENDTLEKMLKSHVVGRYRDLYQSQEFRDAMRRCHAFLSKANEAFFAPRVTSAGSNGTVKAIEAAPGAEAA